MIENKELLDNKLTLLGFFTAGILHDLNVPLTGIQSFSLLCAKGLETNDMDKISRSITNLNISANYMNGLVQSLIGYINSMTPEIEETTEISRLFEDASAIASGTLVKKKITLNIDIAPSLPKITCKKNQILQALLNLIVNAYQAISDENGTINLSASLKTANQIEIQIKDNGKGIPRHILKKLGVAFYSTKKSKSNLGLGLSICYQYIREHQGTISVASEPKSGTCFTITLPASS